MQGGDPEVVIGLSAKLNIAFDGLFPEWSSEVITLIERTMPAPSNIGSPAVQGQEIQGTVAGIVNQLVPSQARA